MRGEGRTSEVSWAERRILRIDGIFLGWDSVELRSRRNEGSEMEEGDQVSWGYFSHLLFLFVFFSILYLFLGLFELRGFSKKIPSPRLSILPSCHCFVWNFVISVSVQLSTLFLE